MADGHPSLADVGIGGGAACKWDSLIKYLGNHQLLIIEELHFYIISCSETLGHNQMLDLMVFLLKIKEKLLKKDWLYIADLFI